MNILIAEPMAAAGIEHFRAQSGWNVIVSNPKEYAQHLADTDALLVRSASVSARCCAYSLGLETITFQPDCARKCSIPAAAIGSAIRIFISLRPVQGPPE